MAGKLIKLLRLKCDPNHQNMIIIPQFHLLQRPVIKPATIPNPMTIIHKANQWCYYDLWKHFFLVFRRLHDAEESTFDELIAFFVLSEDQRLVDVDHDWEGDVEIVFRCFQESVHYRGDIHFKLDRAIG